MAVCSGDCTRNCRSLRSLALTQCPREHCECGSIAVERGVFVARVWKADQIAHKSCEASCVTPPFCGALAVFPC